MLVTIHTAVVMSSRTTFALGFVSGKSKRSTKRTQRTPTSSLRALKEAISAHLQFSLQQACYAFGHDEKHEHEQSKRDGWLVTRRHYLHTECFQQREHQGTQGNARD